MKLPIKSPETDNIKYDFFSIILLCISLLYYLFFAFWDGAVICVDSPSYMEMNIAREPFYPMFLAFFRFIFEKGGEFYLTAAAFAQSILGALAAWSLAAYIYREFRLPRTLAMLVLLVPLGVSFLCRFAAQRGSMYSNSILTEGIAISGFLLFFRYLIEYTFTQKKRSLFLCSLLTFLLLSTRKQMFICLILLVVCIFFVCIRKKEYLKGMLTALSCAFCILAGSVVLDLGYNYALRGEFARHSSDTRFITTVVFYTASRNDSEYIEESSIKDLFLEIYDICYENGYLGVFAGNGWLERVSHFGDSYDCIQIDTMWPLVNEFALASGLSSDVVGLNQLSDQIMNQINRSVLPHSIWKIIRIFADNFLSGLITTVAQRNTILIFYSALIYPVYGFLLFLQFRRKNYKTALFASLTLISIVLNVGLVSLVIFSQTRYTIYNMPLFYISLLMMLYETFLNKKTKKSDKQAGHEQALTASCIIHS